MLPTARLNQEIPQRWTNDSLLRLVGCRNEIKATRRTNNKQERVPMFITNEILATGIDDLELGKQIIDALEERYYFRHSFQIAGNDLMWSYSEQLTWAERQTVEMSICLFVAGYRACYERNPVSVR